MIEEVNKNMDHTQKISPKRVYPLCYQLKNK